MNTRAKTYNCRLTKATGENEAVEITFAAEDADSMAALLDRAGDVVARRVAKHNAAVLSLTDATRRQVEESVDKIKAAHLKELHAEGRLREANGADTASGPADVRTDS